MLDLNTFNCTGCTACYNVCPKNAITMEENEEGFKFPKINLDNCTNCGLCEKICIPKNGYQKKPFKTVAFGAKNKTLEERKQSQSGGAFFVLAKYVLSKGGVVYGALIDEGFVVKHARAYTEEQAKTFRGSKYVQSDLGDIFQSVKEDLQLGVLVLFSGTPCQVAGLKSFLRKDYSNLILMDLICHGVPSPKVWADYIEWQQSRFASSITDAKFRDEEYCWGTHYESFLVGNKKKKFDIYAKIFYSHNAHRESCYTCPFANKERLSDITVGDYWGIENVKAGFRDAYGVSAILINSALGLQVWERVKENFDFFECDVKDLLPRNPQLSKPAEKPVTREIFWKDYSRDFEYIVKKYGGYNLKGKIKILIKRILGRL